MTAPHGAGRPTDRIRTGVNLTCEGTKLLATTVMPSSEVPTTTWPPRGRVARLRDKLGERDLAVLESLAKLRLLTGAQVQRLHAADGSPVTQARRARALLHRLSDLNLVVRLGRRVGGVRAGSSGYVYGLSGYGQAVLDTAGTLGGRRRRVWETKPDFQDHVLSVADTYIGLVEAERAGSLELLDFQAEPPCWRRFAGPHGQIITLKPDAFVRLGVGDVEHSAFVEVDMGTESGPSIARKCGVYASYYNTGIEQAAHDVFPRVLWLANGDTSARRITKVLTSLPRDAQHLFHVTFLADAVSVLTATALGGRRA
jgi:hypothetical protein